MSARIYQEFSPIYDRRGDRKYLNRAERLAFQDGALLLPSPQMRTFCHTMLFSGARISEVCALTPAQIDLCEFALVIQTLKKRKSGVFRTVPVPKALIEDLEATFAISVAQQDQAARSKRLWSWCRTSAWKVVKKNMHQSGLTGPQAKPKGLRHGFAVEAIQSGVPINIVQKWLGHARLQTTAIYADVIGQEERAFAEKMWHGR